VKKKLIEVALPLAAINKACAREKSIRHGHPSTLHLWWARRPLAAARAVIFAQMVDDPSAYVDVLRADSKLHRKAEAALKARLKLWEEARTLANKAKGTGLSVPEPGPAPTLDEMLADQERQRLFRIIEDLVLWENTTNETVLQAAREEIWQSWRRACTENADHPRAKDLFDRKKLPAFHDPFAGGGALPLEALRLGLESYATACSPRRRDSSCASICARRAAGTGSTTTIGRRERRRAPWRCSPARRPRVRPSAPSARISTSTKGPLASASCSACWPSPRNTAGPSWTRPRRRRSTSACRRTAFSVGISNAACRRR